MTTSKPNVIIIGGGAIGLCSAYYLSKNGASVVVLDQGEMGHGSSLHNAGYISPSHFVPLAAPGVFTQGLKWMFKSTSPLYIRPRIDFDFLAWSLNFARACNERVAHRAMPVLLDLLLDSSRLFKELATVSGMDFGLTQKGIIVLYRTEKGRRALHHEHELATEFGLESRLLDHDELRALDPGIEFRAEGGWYVPVDAHLVPATLVKNLADYLERNGVTLHRHTEITRFDTVGNKIVAVHAHNGSFKADEFVLASGAWSPLLCHELGIRMHLQAGKGYSITVRNPQVNPTRPYILNERRVAVTPFSDSLRFAGTMEFAGINLSMNKARVEAILDAVSQYFANVERPNSEKAELWAGLRPVTPDGMAYLGRFKQYPNLIAATGHAMLGISLSAVTGKVVAELIAGAKPSHDLTLLSPNRYD